nr:hypothetical protein [Tanacetum cinerariifolium]
VGYSVVVDQKFHYQQKLETGFGPFGLTGFPIGLLPNLPFPSAFLLANVCS